MKSKLSKTDLAEKAFWNSEEVAAYLGYSYRQFSERIKNMPDFPRPIRLPSITGGRGHPRWRPEEINAWVDKYKQAA